MTDRVDVRTLDREREAIVTTWGRRTGRVHAVEVWWAAGGPAVAYVMAGYGRRSDWARNALSGTGVRVVIAGNRFDADARVVDEAAEHGRAAELLAAKYRPYPGEWETGYLLALELQGTASDPVDPPPRSSVQGSTPRPP